MPSILASLRLSGETSCHGFTPAARARGLCAAVIAVAALAATGVQAQTQQPIQPAPQGQVPQGQAPAAEPPGQPFGDWVQRCPPTPPPGASPPRPGEQEVCFLVHQAIDQATQNPLLKVTVGFFGDERQSGAVIAMPLGVPLARGLQISVDGKELATVPFQVCRRDGCQAYFQMDNNAVAAFKAGTQAMAHVESTMGEGFNLPISLRGFTAGFDSLQ
jgi:invasion protein IalB